MHMIGWSGSKQAPRNITKSGCLKDDNTSISCKSSSVKSKSLPRLDFTTTWVPFQRPKEILLFSVVLNSSHRTQDNQTPELSWALSVFLRNYKTLQDLWRRWHSKIDASHGCLERSLPKTLKKRWKQPASNGKCGNFDLSTPWQPLFVSLVAWHLLYSHLSCSGSRTHKK